MDPTGLAVALLLGVGGGVGGSRAYRRWQHHRKAQALEGANAVYRLQGRVENLEHRSDTHSSRVQILEQEFDALDKRTREATGEWQLSKGSVAAINIKADKALCEIDQLKGEISGQLSEFLDQAVVGCAPQAKLDELSLECTTRLDQAASSIGELRTTIEIMQEALDQPAEAAPVAVDPELATKLEELQQWIGSEVIPRLGGSDQAVAFSAGLQQQVASITDALVRQQARIEQLEAATLQLSGDANTLALQLDQLGAAATAPSVRPPIGPAGADPWGAPRARPVPGFPGALRLRENVPQQPIPSQPL
jgi:chromosome segregation ATPase